MHYSSDIKVFIQCGFVEHEHPLGVDRDTEVVLNNLYLAIMIIIMLLVYKVITRINRTNQKQKIL